MRLWVQERSAISTSRTGVKSSANRQQRSGVRVQTIRSGLPSARDSAIAESITRNRFASPAVGSTVRSRVAVIYFVDPCTPCNPWPNGPCKFVATSSTRRFCASGGRIAGGLLQRERFERRQRVMVRHVRLQRRDGDV